MSVLIRGMEMPFTCLTCDFHKCAGGVGDFCSLTKRRQFRFKNRPKDCPLIEIPETHGRLIDTDALKKILATAIPQYSLAGCTTYADSDIMRWIDEAPTVIPAGPEEEKMK